MAPSETSIPAYDLSFLLRKLPGQITTEPDNNKRVISYPLRLEAPIVNWSSGRWAFFYENSEIWAEDDTLEDTAAKLCISLFERDILKKEMV